MELPSSTYSRQHDLNPFSANVTTLPSRAAAYGGHTLPSPPIWSGSDRLQEYAAKPRSQLGFGRYLLNDESLSSDRPSEFTASRSLPTTGQLPSIHELGIMRNSQPNRDSRRESPTSYSPTNSLPSPPTKRRRSLSEEDQDYQLRERVVPRLDNTSPSLLSRPFQSSNSSPTSATRGPGTRSSYESWPPSDRSSPYMAATRGQTTNTTPISDLRRTLPSISTLDSYPTPITQVAPLFAEYALNSSRTVGQNLPQFSGSFAPTHPSPYSSAYDYPQSRGQSYSGPSSYSMSSERSTPFSNTHHNMFSSTAFSPMDAGESSNDRQPRKRRGNLPKDTTDKLRKWFHSNLQHPYPTEDQKQDLMRQTGLHMNQISNWFINARRRHLPTLINNAQVESNARAARTNDNAARERPASDYGDGPRGSLGDSDGDGSAYGEDYNLRSRSSAPSLNQPLHRGSL